MYLSRRLCTTLASLRKVRSAMSSTRSNCIFAQCQRRFSPRTVNEHTFGGFIFESSSLCTTRVFIAVSEIDARTRQNSKHGQPKHRMEYTAAHLIIHACDSRSSILDIFPDYPASDVACCCIGTPDPSFTAELSSRCSISQVLACLLVLGYKCRMQWSSVAWHGCGRCRCGCRRRR